MITQVFAPSKTVIDETRDKKQNLINLLRGHESHLFSDNFENKTDEYFVTRSRMDRGPTCRWSDHEHAGIQPGLRWWKASARTTTRDIVQS